MMPVPRLLQPSHDLGVCTIGPAFMYSCPLSLSLSIAPSRPLSRSKAQSQGRAIVAAWFSRPPWLCWRVCVHFWPKLMATLMF